MPVAPILGTTQFYTHQTSQDSWRCAQGHTVGAWDVILPAHSASSGVKGHLMNIPFPPFSNSPAAQDREGSCLRLNSKLLYSFVENGRPGMVAHTCYLSPQEDA